MVVLPYGMDVQDQRITSNLIYKDGYINDYPDFRFYNNDTSKKFNSGKTQQILCYQVCDWIKYMFYWDDILISHFAIETEKKSSQSKKKL